MLSVFLIVNAIISGFISLGGTIGNILIIVAFINTKSLQNINNTFLLQLAIVDGTKAVFIVGVETYTMLAEQFHVPGFYCPFSGFISCVTFIQSALLLSAIAAVRYVKIVRTRSFDKVFSRPRMICYCASLYFATFLLAILPLIGVGEYEYSRYHGVCFTRWVKKNIVFRMLFYVYIMAICYPALIICYTLIFIALRKHKKRVMVNARIARQRSAEKADARRSLAAAKQDSGVYKIMESSSNLEDIVENGNDVNMNENGEVKVVKWDLTLEGDLNETQTDECTEQQSNNRDRSTAKLSVPDNEIMPDGNSKDGSNGGKNFLTKAKKISVAMFPPRKISSDSKSEMHRRPRATSNLSKRAIRNEIRVTKVMFTVVIAFSICWLPAFFVNMMQYGGIEVSPTILYIIITLVDAKVFINPLIYGIWNKQFRVALKAVFMKGIAATSSTSREGDSRASQSNTPRT